MSDGSYYNQEGTPFLYTGGDQVGPGGMDCLQLRHQPAGPFHYLISEQAKSLVALQELQHEVGALLEFRDLVMETFPNLRTKLAQSTPNTMTSHHHHTSNIPVSIRPGDWTPGVRVRKKIGSKEESRSSKKGGDITVQDSGFSTEASSKETHSASSTAPPPSTNAGGTAESDEVEDELWNLLDIIHRKGTRLKREAEALQNTIREQGNFSGEVDYTRTNFRSSADDIQQLRQERDVLLDKLSEMEAEVLAGRVHTTRLQEDLENLLTTKHDLEEQLKAVVTQRGEVNSRIHDLHSQFVTKSGIVAGDSDRLKFLSDKKDTTSSSQRTSNNRKSAVSELDSVLGDKLPKVKVPDSKKISAILKEHDPLVLQKHLLTTTVQNQVLQQKLDSAVDLEMGLRDELNKFREENEDLRFQIEDKNIELEGTRARIRLLEDLQKPLTKTTSPDIIPLGSPTDRPHSRTEITTSSMKNMSPLPLNLQMDHSSSTESAQDQAEKERKDGNTKRRPSKIPLKSYTAPKPPGGKHSPAPGTRSRSGDSPGRPHSAQSWRNKSEGNSLNTSKGSNTSLPKSRNSSLVSARDSLSSKLRSSDSLMKLSSPGSNNFGKNSTPVGTMKKTSTPIKWTGSTGQMDEKIQNSNSAKGKSPSQWILSSYNSELDQAYPDSLDKNDSVQQSLTENSSSHRFQTANTFLWNVGNPQFQNEYYDSIDSNVVSGFYQPDGGEDLAECDSLERQLSDFSDKK